MSTFTWRLVSLLVTLGASPLSAQRAQVAVAVIVVTDNEFTAQVRSVVTRELRRFSNVAVVPEKGTRDFVVSVGAVPLRLVNNQQLSGICLSYVLVAEDRFSHQVSVIGVNDLSTSLERVVAEFDTGFLEPRRRSPR